MDETFIQLQNKLKKIAPKSKKIGQQNKLF